MNDNCNSVKTSTREDILIALMLMSFTILLLVITAPQIGLTWDEPTYILAAEKYPSWFSELFNQPRMALSEEVVSQYWEFNHEHPPLSKVWSGFVWLGARHIFDDLTSHRIGNILLSGLLIALLYLMLAREYGRTAGLIGGIALLTMPRFFFHAHLSALDVPVTAMIFAVTYVFWLGRNQPGFRWTLLLGLVWGLALATKINALFIPPIVLLVWTVFFQPRRYLFIRLVLMGLIGVGIFFLSWPWLYYDTYNRLLTYLGFFTIDRHPIEQVYFGHFYTPPPWHFPFVIAIIVVPFSLILLAAIGAFFSMSNRVDRPLGGLFILGGFISLLVLASGRGQVFDNERLLMPVFPYLSALAGIGFVRVVPIVWQFTKNKGLTLRSTQLVTILVIAIFGPHLILAYDLYPHCCHIILRLWVELMVQKCCGWKLPIGAKVIPKRWPILTTTRNLTLWFGLSARMFWFTINYMANSARIYR